LDKPNANYAANWGLVNYAKPCSAGERGWCSSMTPLHPSNCKPASRKSVGLPTLKNDNGMTGVKLNSTGAIAGVISVTQSYSSAWRIGMMLSLSVNVRLLP
jgi:hypothetical protein